MRRFGIVAAAVAGATLLLTVAVIWRGDRVAYEPVSVEPAAGAVGVSTRAPLVVRFGRDVDGRTLAGRLRLEPSATGALGASGPAARWDPRPGLAPDTEYTLVVEPGIRSTSGRASVLEHRSTFRTRPARLLLARHGADAIELVAATLDGREQSLARIEPSARDLALAPEGDRLAYVASERLEPGNDRLRVVDLLSGEQLTVEEVGLVALARPDWSPDGRRLAYERRVVGAEPIERVGAAGPPREIRQVGVDGGPPATVYGGPGEVGYMPLWAPFGERLAFFEPSYKVVAIHDSGPTVATIPWGGGTLVGWAPDGTRLLATEAAPSPADPARSAVRLLDAGGGAGLELTPPDATDRGPAWSPDGSTIALVRRGPAGSGIWLVDPTGGYARPVLAGGGWAYLRPSWSADGRRLAFARLARDGASPEPELWVADLGGEARRLALAGELVAWVP